MVERRPGAVPAAASRRQAVAGFRHGAAAVAKERACEVSRRKPQPPAPPSNSITAEKPSARVAQCRAARRQAARGCGRTAPAPATRRRRYNEGDAKRRRASARDPVLGVAPRPATRDSSMPGPPAGRDRQHQQVAAEIGGKRQRHRGQSISPCCSSGPRATVPECSSGRSRSSKYRPPEPWPRKA